MGAGLALFAALALGVWPGGESRPPLLQFGADSAEGMLVNRSPGSRPFDPVDPRRPTIVFIHGCNPAPKLVHFTMTNRLAEAIGQRYGTRFNVLEWDWNAATFVGLKRRGNETRALEQGRRLASALLHAGLAPARIHLIGHSSGAIVAASAARTVLDQGQPPMAQLTLLDPALMYHRLVFDFLKAGTLSPRVENYWTSRPSGYGGVAQSPGIRNFQVVGPTPYLGTVSVSHSNHFHVVYWYLASIQDRAYPGGFNTSVLAVAPGL